MSMITEPIITDKTGRRLVVELEKLNAYSRAQEEKGIVAGFDGTTNTYSFLMRSYFARHGALTATPEELTAICDEWYEITRTGWDGGTKFSKSTAVPTGIKIGDNEGLQCIPSTNTVANIDDYAGLPQFAVVDVNWTLNINGDILITAIDGITNNFERRNPDKYVGVMQMSLYHYWNEDEQSYTHGVTDVMNRIHGNIAPLPEAVKTDSSMRNFVVHTKYMSKTVNNKLTAYAGPIPTARNISHNTLHTLSRNIGTYYSGGCGCDWSFLQLMAFIKYGSMSLDGILQGCCNNNFSYLAQVSETGVKRVLLTEEQGNNVEVGMGVLVGHTTDDRNNGNCYAVSGGDGWLVTAVESVTINDTKYKAVYLDASSTFDTTSGTTRITSYHWPNGTCDKVLGNDGSPANPGSDKYPAKLQGIEYAVGAWEVFADFIQNIARDENGHSYYEVFVCNKAAKQATSITADYKSASKRIACPATDNWCYTKKLGFTGEMFYPEEIGASSSTYTKDGFYMNRDGMTGTREGLAFASLYVGSATGGLSALAGSSDLSCADWSIAARLSPNGQRG